MKPYTVTDYSHPPPPYRGDAGGWGGGILVCMVAKSNIGELEDEVRKLFPGSQGSS